MKVMRWVPFFAIAVLAATSFSGELPTNTSTIFAGSGVCAGCHEASSSNPAALVDPGGVDISPVTLWRSTVMANAARDPIWQAKVTAEVAAHPALADDIEDKCTTCHTPAGRTEAIFGGAAKYTLQEAQADPLAMDGVTCTVCHQIQNDNLGTDSSFSGNFIIDDSRRIFGPYGGPWSPIMEGAVGYSIERGAQVHRSELCATCHTLFTPTIDNSGQVVGEIAEQTPYLEWKNSVYPALDVQCQSCHIPQIDDEVIITTVPPNMPPRNPFGKHYFVGGNVFLLEMLRDNGAAIGTTASEALFDSTIARTLQQLREFSIDMTATYEWDGADTLQVNVGLRNKAGHKFPTGFPSRRAWLHLRVTDASGATAFESGNWDASGEIAGLDSPYEPHHDVITQEDQVIVYQSLMQDVDQQVTWTLLRGASYIKDNRIPPDGFRRDGVHYDSTAIAGLAEFDPNFNRQGGVEGSGTDEVSYRIGGLDATQTYTVDVALVYQSLAPAFVADMFQYSSPEIEALQGYYAAADLNPIEMVAKSLNVTDTAVEELGGRASTIRIVGAYPNPVQSSASVAFELRNDANVRLTLVDLLGREVRMLTEGRRRPGSHTVTFDATGLPAGVYFYRLDADGSSATRKALIVR